MLRSRVNVGMISVLFLPLKAEEDDNETILLDMQSSPIKQIHNSVKFNKIITSNLMILHKNEKKSRIQAVLV